VFSKLKSLNISALEEDRKTMAFDKLEAPRSLYSSPGYNNNISQ
jgi:hypothetical protein